LKLHGGATAFPVISVITAVVIVMSHDDTDPPFGDHKEQGSGSGRACLPRRVCLRGGMDGVHRCCHLYDVVISRVVVIAVWRRGGTITRLSLIVDNAKARLDL
jgi:hypothetical protein